MCVCVCKIERKMFLDVCGRVYSLNLASEIIVSALVLRHMGNG